MEDRTFRIEHFTTQAGATLDLQLAYRVHGKLNAAKDNGPNPLNPHEQRAEISSP
jgi:hypothetical protein